LLTLDNFLLFENVDNIWKNLNIEISIETLNLIQILKFWKTLTWHWVSMFIFLTLNWNQCQCRWRPLISTNTHQHPLWLVPAQKKTIYPKWRIKALFTRDILTHNISIKKIILSHWFLLTKVSSERTTNQGTLCFDNVLRATIKGADRKSVKKTVKLWVFFEF